MKVIFDTDPGGDIDDVAALAMLHALADRGEVEIIAVGASHGHPLTIPFIHAVNSYFGRADIPLGTVPAPGPYQRDEFMADVIGSGPHSVSQDSVPEAADLYRDVLSKQADGSVTIVAVGPPTNIARLLQQPSGVDLVRRKVGFYSAGGNGRGELPEGRVGFNYHQDNSAARVELALMPQSVPMVFAGGSGLSLELGECYRNASAKSIVRRSYEAYFKDKPNFNRPTWDLLRVLYGCRIESRKYFATSPPGEITLNPDHSIKWNEAPGGNKAYAYVEDFPAVREELTVLMMHEPGGS